MMRLLPFLAQWTTTMAAMMVRVRRRCGFATDFAYSSDS